MNYQDHLGAIFESQQEEIQANGNYVQALDPEIVKRLSQPTPAAAAAMQESLTQMLGNLPSPHFQVTLAKASRISRSTFSFGNDEWIFSPPSGRKDGDPRNSLLVLGKKSNLDRSRANP
ncbi:MAG: DUF760 domain-containing protein [Prochloraceae cyanobacterium]|nr:DUF760 domain-containing protein [Prochloraceae cyanobacterium]